MEKSIIFREMQEAQAQDYIDLQTFADDSLIHVVADGISDERHFTGFGTVAEGPTTLAVSPGRYYELGKVFGLNTPTEFNMFQYLATATKKIVALVVYGGLQETRVEPRDFLIQVGSDETEPHTVAMERWRKASLQLVPGVESATPAAPATGESAVVIAFITMNSTQIESIDFQYRNLLPNGLDNRQGIAALNAWKTQIGPSIESLNSQVAGTRESIEGLASLTLVRRMAAEIGRLREEANIPDGAIAYAADTFQDDDKTDTALTGNGAIVNRGLFFPSANTATTALQLFNPIEPKVKKTPDDFVLPAYTETPKIKSEGYNGDLSLSAYQTLVRETKLVKKTEQRWVSGRTYVSDYMASVYNGTSVHGSEVAYILNQWYGYNGYGEGYNFNTTGYYESYQSEHYEEVEETVSYNGTMVGQTFLSPNAFWGTSLDLFFTQIGPQGDVTIVVTDTALGTPNPQRTYLSVTVDRADLKQYPLKTNIPIDPMWFEAGKRYAINIITEGTHRVATVSAGNFTQGTLFYNSDGAWFQGDLTKDLMFTLNGAAFSQTRIEVQLNPVSLNGGLTDIDIASEAIVPAGTQLSYEAQIGGIWKRLADGDPFWATKPNLVPMRLVFLGTVDAMPGVQFGPNRIKASRPAEAMSHFSTLRDLDANSDDITVTLRAVQFDPAKHTLTAQLVNNAGGSPINPTLAELKTEVLNSGEVVHRKTFTFAPGAPLGEYKIKTAGTRGAGDMPFTVIERTDVAI